MLTRLQDATTYQGVFFQRVENGKIGCLRRAKERSLPPPGRRSRGEQTLGTSICGAVRAGMNPSFTSHIASRMSRENDA
jgi:hypothetical protein